MNKRKVLLFDLDWTLVYTGGAGVKALDHAFENLYGIAESMKQVVPDGKTDRAICREMISLYLKRDPEPGEIEKLCRAYLDQLAVEVPAASGYRILAGILPLLESLSPRTDVLLGLGTGNLEEGARIKLAPAGLMKYFPFGGFGSDAEARPDVLRAGVQRGEAIAGHTILPRDVVVIGDNMRDVQAGQAIGAKTMGVASGPMSYEELAKTNPDHLFHDLSETPKVLAALLS